MDANPLRAARWSPYLVGAGIGVLSWFAFLSADRPLGVTTPFEHTAALGVQAAGPAEEGQLPYFQEHRPRIGWEWMLVVGIFGGALTSAVFGRDRNPHTIPSLWYARFGPSRPLRLGAAFLGGAIMIYGARLAQGCTTGHVISGALQLSLASWLFAIVIFLAGIATALVLFGPVRRQSAHDAGEVGRV